MSTLYLNKVHGLPDLDLKLDIDGKNIAATVYSANDYGGTFGYPNGIEYNISAGGRGFTVNTGSFSYTTSGEVIKTGSGMVGNGDLMVTTTCYGTDDEGCFGPNEPNMPTLNTSKSQDIPIDKIPVFGVSQHYVSSHVANTLIMLWAGFGSTPPSFLDFSGDYIENPMSADIDLGSGTFKSFTVSPKASQSGSLIATYDKNYSGWTFTDTELLTIYQGSGGGSGEQEIYLELAVNTTDGSAQASYPIKIGGTSWVNNGLWKRTVPYIEGLNKPCVLYTNINGLWQRGNP